MLNANIALDNPDFSPEERFARDVQITRDEYLRQLPDALGGAAFELNGNVVTVDQGEGRVRIRLTDRGEKELGELRMPMMRLEFAFDGMDEEEISEFMEIYDANTLRGSGGM